MPEPAALASLSAVAVAVLGALLYVIRAEIRKNTQTTDITAKQMVPNHGASLRDAVDRIETHIGELREDINHVRQRVDRHVDSHDHGGN